MSDTINNLLDQCHTLLDDLRQQLIDDLTKGDTARAQSTRRQINDLKASIDDLQSIHQ